MKEGKVRQETRRRKTDDTVFTDSTTNSSTIDNAFTSEKSAYKRVNFANFDCHTSSFTTDLDSVKSSIDTLLRHRLPRARQRTNVVTQDYTPRGRLFGGYTTRGEGVTIASYRFPHVVTARPSGFTDEPYLSAQLNAAASLPVHKDKHNHSRTWLIAFGDFTGGRLWIESPIGTHPPPNPRNVVERKLRGDYYNTHNTWICFDPQLYHALEEITSGNRVSIALFTPKSWKRLTPNCIDELIDIGFYPPHSALSTGVGAIASSDVATSSISSHASSCAMPTGSVATPTLSLADPTTCDATSTSVIPLVGQMESSDLASLLFGPLPPAAMTFDQPQFEEEKALQEWCDSDLVSLPFEPLPSSDGTIQPLDDSELQELSDHLRSGHSTKSNLCRGCLEADGPRKMHRSIRDIDRAMHVLHIDIAGPFTTSDDGFTYFLVGALRLPGLPLLIDVRLLTSRTSVEVCDALERMVAFFESLHFEGFTITDSSRVKRLHSDRAGEFTAPFFERFLINHKSIYHTFTSGYDPQANGTAERAVGLVKSLAARALATSQLDVSYWSYSVRYAAQSLLCHALQRRQRSLPFGSSVVARLLDYKDVRFPNSRTLTGRLLFWNHMEDQVSFILCPPEGQDLDPLVYRAGLPAKRASRNRHQ